MTVLPPSFKRPLPSNWFRQKYLDLKTENDKESIETFLKSAITNLEKNLAQTQQMNFSQQFLYAFLVFLIIPFHF